MKPTQRIEVVVDAQHVDRVTELLREHGARGYTVVRNASGWGDRGRRVPDGVSGAFENCLVLCACEPETWTALTEPLRTLLKRCGGVAVVSEASLLIH